MSLDQLGPERFAASRVLRLATAVLVPAILFLAWSVIPGIAVRAALYGIDHGADIGSVSLGPGVVLMEDLRMPGQNATASTVVVFWSFRSVLPSADSILVSGSTLGLGGCGSPRGGSRTSPSLPPIILDGAEITYGSDTTLFQGRLSLEGDSVIAKGFASGGWGSATLELEKKGGTASFSADFFDCTAIPFFPARLPDSFDDAVFSGSLEGMVARDSVLLRGTVREADGIAVEIPFSLSFSEESSSLRLRTGLEGATGIADGWIRSFDPEAWVSLEPRGTVELLYQGGDSCLFTVSAGLEEAGLHSGYIADDTVRFDCSVEISGVLRPDRLSIDSGLVLLGTFPLNFTLEAVPGDSGMLELNAWSLDTPGEDLTTSVPGALLGPLGGLELSGPLDLDIHLRIDRRNPDSSDVTINIDPSALTVLSCPISIGAYASGGSCRMRDSWGNTELIWLNPALNESFVSLSNLPAWFEPLLCCAEDGSFRSHRGFSPQHIRSSLIDDVRAGRFVRGASTITMQLARNLFLSREKTLARKLQEVFLTWRLEELLSKDRILEIYANIVELGPGVFGFGEASLYYFGTPVGELGVRETAFLVSILPGPKIYYSFYETGRVPDWWEDYLDLLIDTAADRGGIPRAAAALALDGSIRFNRE